MDDYGPPLPPGFNLEFDEDSASDNEQPPEKLSEKTKQFSKLIGPQLPDFLSEKQTNDISNSPERHKVSDSHKFIGPDLPSSFQASRNEDSDDDDAYYGPMPSDSKSGDYDLISTIEKRAEKMKNKLDNKDIPSTEAVQREEWMVVPDTSRRNQLGAISRCLAPSSKPLSSSDKHSHHRSEKDKKTSEELKKYNKSRRSESLLEMHRKEKKKKKEKSSKPEERKAFDREEIAVRHFTKQQVNSVIDKAKYLNSRFSAGSNKYL